MIQQKPKLNSFELTGSADQCTWLIYIGRLWRLSPHVLCMRKYYCMHELFVYLFGFSCSAYIILTTFFPTSLIRLPIFFFQHTRLTYFTIFINKFPLISNRTCYYIFFSSTASYFKCRCCTWAKKEFVVTEVWTHDPGHSVPMLNRSQVWWPLGYSGAQHLILFDLIQTSETWCQPYCNTTTYKVIEFSLSPEKNL